MFKFGIVVLILRCTRVDPHIELDDIFIAVKTTKSYKDSRLPIIYNTWIQRARRQTWIFTDSQTVHNPPGLNSRMVKTNCSSQQKRKEFKERCCKVSRAYDFFIESNKKWFCQFNDDVYINIPRLLSTLQNYNYAKDWYIGHSTLKKPGVTIVGNLAFKANFAGSYMFASFGAGMCMSRSLALKCYPFIRFSKLSSYCQKIRGRDDIALGYVVGYLLKVPLIDLPVFHSHFENLARIPVSTLHKQITFSYLRANTIRIPGFPKKKDPTRFLSLHCYLFPIYKFCNARPKSAIRAIAKLKKKHDIIVKNNTEQDETLSVTEYDENSYL